MMQKKCSHCKETRAMSEFGKNRSRKDGHSHYCKKCQRKTQAKYDASHREQRKAHSKKWRDNNKEYCRKYYKKYHSEHKKERNEYSKLYATRNKDKVRQWGRAKHKKLRDEVYSHYGGYICNCCGEIIKEFLTIDHIHGGGNAHRKKVGKAGIKFYYWLKRNNYPSGFQILCFNCNCGRARNEGICPHLNTTVNNNE